MHNGASGCALPLPHVCLLLSHRLQDLTVRDLEKQEREKAANSLEAFIFETQVGRVGGTLALGPVSGSVSLAHRGSLHAFAYMYLPRTSYTSPSTRKCPLRNSVKRSLGDSTLLPLGWRMKALEPPQW